MKYIFFSLTMLSLCVFNFKILIKSKVLMEDITLMKGMHLFISEIELRVEHITRLSFKENTGKYICKTVSN